MRAPTVNVVAQTLLSADSTLVSSLMSVRERVEMPGTGPYPGSLDPADMSVCATMVEVHGEPTI